MVLEIIFGTGGGLIHASWVFLVFLLGTSSNKLTALYNGVLETTYCYNI